MAKYAPLKQFLRSQNRDHVPMTFAEIEHVIAIKLPPSADSYRAWWSNNPSNNVMTQAWLEAGYETEQVDLPGRKLVFRRVRRLPDRSGPGDAETLGVGLGGANTPPSGFAELPTPILIKPAREGSPFGWLRGTVGMAPGTDLTAPADADWGRIDDQFPAA